VEVFLPDAQERKKISELVSQESFGDYFHRQGVAIHDIWTPLASAATRAVLRLDKLAR